MRPFGRLAGWSLALLAAAAVSGCVHRYPPDLRIELRGVADRESVVPIAGGMPVPVDEVIVLDVSSPRKDWYQRARRWIASLSVHGGFCDGRQVPRLTVLGLYSNGRFAGAPLPTGQPNVLRRDGGGRYVAQALLRIREDGEMAAYGDEERDFGRFDLAKEPRDVCLHLRGGAMILPIWYRSSVVRIPAAEIESVLDRSARSAPGNAG